MEQAASNGIAMLSKLAARPATSTCGRWIPMDEIALGHSRGASARV
jgi:hypothetical protein